MDYTDIAIKTAQESKCNKRKVGAIIVSNKGTVIARGYNYNPDGSNCEDIDGKTKESVVHAEIVAIDKVNNWSAAETIYVTHPPCEGCQRAIDFHNLKLIVVTDFMKFDNNKLRYSLIPPIAMRELAKVLTYGAKKYKPNNWQKVDDLERYVDALYRHLEAWRSGETNDPESGLSHLSHAITNISFLLYLTITE